MSEMDGPSWLDSGLSSFRMAKLTRIDYSTTGELRLGVWMEFGDMGGGWKFRHWGCVTERQIANMKVALGDDCTQLLGYDDLDNEDQHMIEKAFREGKGELFASKVEAAELTSDLC